MNKELCHPSWPIKPESYLCYTAGRSNAIKRKPHMTTGHMITVTYVGYVFLSVLYYCTDLYKVSLLLTIRVHLYYFILEWDTERPLVQTLTTREHVSHMLISSKLHRHRCLHPAILRVP